jgi:hypothetical protein
LAECLLATSGLADPIVDCVELTNMSFDLWQWWMAIATGGIVDITVAQVALAKAALPLGSPS